MKLAGQKRTVSPNDGKFYYCKKSFYETTKGETEIIENGIL